MTDVLRARLMRPEFRRRNDYSVTTANERAVLNVIRRGSPISRADVARLVNLSGMSISRIVDGLIERGLVREGDKMQGIRGPTVSLALNPDAAYSLGIAVMSDAVSLSLMDFSGKIRFSSLEVAPDMRRETVLRLASDRLAKWMKRDGLVPDRLFAIGVGVSGFFVEDGARFNAAPALDDWALLDIEDKVSAYFDRPAWIDNDGNAAIIGETLLGVGRWASSFAYIYVAAGVGGGLVVNGRPLRGRMGNAGEFASVLPPDFVHPNLNLLRDMIAQAGVPTSSLSDMIARFRMDWPGVDAWLDLTQASFNLIVSAASAVLDPEAVVLGGRLPPPLASCLAERAQVFNTTRRGRPRPLPRIVAAETEGDATAIGAAAIPLHEHFFAP